ncbi:MULTISPECIES: ABC transporter permease [Pasteurellaceae]|uniref:Iron ABC transporter permease n=1 Tax=Pasteurella atlantica TaxID=2827233 RepID=A0AAW8CSF4_9PAST|nr:iron ABC transporter permease [Pasteurella atlantica]MBR0574573.1 iron ABC transporter permease [Pasteurella atlantica]MDP8040431.1 iron ABC transporter permease [Pasteurella atlantica]MDP8042597.1 iron ABC transporter permease [Pasteurella atlantica]MDP8044708.1 iron ABC transporter permease [Pasteurella atlantica]MDP8046756.1 iron ABC transporter permease [Pasteurella atlantica]
MKNHNFIWKFSSLLITTMVLLPLLAIVYNSFDGEIDNLIHLWNTTLGIYVVNSGLLVLGTVGFALFFALPSAWIVSSYQFKGKQSLQWLLCFPLAIPAYLSAYIYTDLLDYSGEIQTLLRDIFGWQNAQDYWFPQARTMYGACFILALVLYPYIFLVVRVALLEQSENLLQSAKILGAKKLRLFTKVTFPLISSAIVVGISLVAMETLGDFGTVSYFAVSTLTTAIYDSWLGFGDFGTASRIAVFMLFIIFLLISVENYSRRKQKIYQRGYEQKVHQKQLRGKWLFFAYLWCGSLLSLAFFIPFGRLLYWSFHYFEQSWNSGFLEFAKNSLQVSAIASIIAIILALILHFTARFSQRTPVEQNLSRLSLQVSSMGYAISGTVLAIGLLSVLNLADHKLHWLLKLFDLPPVGLIFSGSIFALIIAYVIRFLAMTIGSIDNSLSKISPSLDMASQTMGKNGIKMLTKVHFPLISKGIITAGLMVFIECMKELNASLLLRPFNFETLATYLFNLTSTEQLEEAALSAVILVIIGIIPVIWLTRSLISQSQKEHYNEIT